MTLYVVHLERIISTVSGQVDHGGHHVNFVLILIYCEASKTDHTDHKSFGYSKSIKVPNCFRTGH